MTHNQNQWPQYNSPYEMLSAETGAWGARLEVAQARHSSLEGELPDGVRTMAIAIIDGHTEPPERFSLLDIYEQRGLDSESSGALLSINYEGAMPNNARDLIEVIREQRARTSVPAAIALLGYTKKRRIDQLRSETWDIAVAHALRHGIDHSIIGISNDADMVSVSEDYFPEMIQNSHASQIARVWGSEVEFSQPGGADLPLHKLVAYLNGGRQILKAVANKPVMYGGSLALTLETYVASGGWRRRDNSNTYGIGEPSCLIVNAWERLTGEKGTLDNTYRPYEACARRVGGLATVSPRREIFAFARELNHEDNLTAHLDTKPDNPYRRLDDDEIALLADSVSLDDPAVASQLDDMDDVFLSHLPDDCRASAKVAQRELRERLELPIRAR